MSRKGMRVVVVCGMTEKKLTQKISPLQAIPQIEEIILVRKEPYSGEKIKTFPVPFAFKNNILTVEMWRFFVTIYIGLFCKPDIGICMTLVGHSFFVYILKVVFRVPSIYHIMGKQDCQLHNPKRLILQKILWWWSLKPDAIVVRGEPTRQKYISQGRVDPNKVFVQHNVFDFKGYKPDDNVIKEYDLVYVGYLAKYKNLDLLLKIICNLKKENIELKTAFVGNGKLTDTLKSQARDLNIENQILFLGHTNNKNLIKILQKSKIFVMTSLGEGLPQAMIEAMACGLPCILFDDADMREIIIPQENGILVPPVNLDLFSKEIKKLLDDSTYYNQISSNALKIKKDYKYIFSVEAQMKVWENVIKTALNKERL